MKIKFNVATGSVVMTYKNDNATLEEALDLASREEVISITITKQSPAQYLKSVRSLNNIEENNCNNCKHKSDIGLPFGCDGIFHTSCFAKTNT